MLYVINLISTQYLGLSATAYSGGVPGHACQLNKMRNVMLLNVDFGSPRYSKQGLNTDVFDRSAVHFHG